MSHDDFDLLPCVIEEASSIQAPGYDALVLVTHTLDLDGDLAPLRDIIESHIKIDASAQYAASVIGTKDVLSGRLIYALTGPIDRDLDDVRRFGEAAAAGVQRATDAGAASLLLTVVPSNQYPNSELVGLTGALGALYVPCEARKHGIQCKIKKLGILLTSEGRSAGLLRQATSLELGQAVMRDIFVADPVFMAPPAAAIYIKGVLNIDNNIKITVIEDQEQILNEYPTVAAVGRAVKDTPHFQSRIVKLTYEDSGPTEETLMMVGKGVTFDTGGMNLKINIGMQGMRYDKGGAAAIAGFFKILSSLKPANLKVVATLPFVRNAIGIDAYTCDELINARSGKRIRIVNTDAEGRMIMLDPLTEMREQAANETNPHLFTMATLTGHVLLCTGIYPVTLDNGPAMRIKTSELLRDAGEAIGQPMDVGTLRREDIAAVQNRNVYADLLQAPPKSSSQTHRGHQIPMAFLIEGSLLSQHGRDSTAPLPYTHIDMAAVPFEPMPETSPLLALAARYILPRLKSP